MPPSTSTHYPSTSSAPCLGCTSTTADSFASLDRAVVAEATNLNYHAPPADQLTAQCTDQCVVIACSNPDHPESICPRTGSHTQCDFVCDEAVDCVDCHGFDAFLQCCDDYHPYTSTATPATTSSSWETAFAEWCATCAVSPPVTASTSSARSPERTFDGNGIGSAAHPMTGFASVDETFGQRAPTPTAPSPPQAYSCMWAACNANFSCLSELVGHVNLDHLAHSSSSAPSSLGSQTPSGSSFHSSMNSLDQNASAISCLWDNCGSSYYSTSDNSFELLAHHLLNEHLGADPPPLQHHQQLGHHQPQNHPQMQHQHHQQPQHQHHHQPQHQHINNHSTNSTSTHNTGARQVTIITRKIWVIIVTTPTEGKYTNSNPRSTQPAHQHTPTPSHLPSPTLPPSLPSLPSITPQQQRRLAELPRGRAAYHECRWKACGAAFHSCDALTAHIGDVHIGAGKARYECFGRSVRGMGRRGFRASRRFRACPGHRPFQCSICQQNFSEAATLQQHTRRHTQEKPYVCDFPGCGKSFAITGALTIHKRTHNGDKPFKCTYCDRGFAESSNLSKHLRTHTGARPYICAEPGCNKAFARPDQLNRHKSVHQKQTRGIGGRATIEA
ncbi:hypothetical protein BJ912DRAFT_944900 [Pholiota molesta]|nr:hypothetical protein BJ912DRAFT_944900 [Pholiota molesta]